jgi:vancomycin resistance protein YoaR
MINTQIKLKLLKLIVILSLSIFTIESFEQIKAERDDVIQKNLQYQQDQEEINKTIREMRKYNPKATRQQACVFVGKQKAFAIPGKVARLSAAAETEFNQYAVGIFGERGTHQAMWFTKEAYFPGKEGLIYYEVASWKHLKMCFEASGRRTLLTLAYHNAGIRKNAMWAARKHVSRCRGILRRMEA